MASSSSASSMFAPECVLYTTASSSSLVGSMGLTSLSAPTSTSPYVSFKGLSDPPSASVTFIPTSPNPSQSGLGGLIFQLENNKATLNVYSFQRDHPVQRIILPQKLSCIACSPDGEFIAAGTFDGRIFLWQIATGDLLASFDAHYRSVTVLKWSPDGAALVTGSEDARILVWSLTGLLSPRDQTTSSITSSDANPTPYCTLSDHNLAITDLVVAGNRFPNQTTILSSSTDATVKLWDVRTRSLLSTFAFQQPILKISLDITERFFFASTSPSSSKNLIYRIDLFRKKAPFGRIAESAPTAGAFEFTTQALKGITPLEARGFGGPGDIERISFTEPPAGTSIIEINEPISSLCLSLNSTTLLVGSTAGNLFVIDVHNSQILRTVSLLGNAKSSAVTGSNAVTNLMVLPKPRDLLGSWETSSANATSSAAIPVRPIANFGRHVLADQEDRNGGSYLTRIAGNSIGNLDIEDLIDPVWDSNLVPDASAFGTSIPYSGLGLGERTGSKAAALSSTSQEDVERLTKEVDQLKAQLSKAKAFNDEMWNRLVQDRLNGTVADVNGSSS